MSQLHEALSSLSPTATIILSVSLMLFVGFAATRLTKLVKLPNVTAYILTGILLGPYCLDLIPLAVVDGMDFLSDITLAFISFNMGEFLRVEALRKNGLRVIVITLLEAMLAAVGVFLVLYFAFGLPLPLTIVLAAMAATTSSTSTVTIIRQTGARGDFVDTLIQVAALDVIVGLMAYSVAISVAGATEGAGLSVGAVILPLVTNLGVMVVGGGFGFLMKLLMTRKRSTDNRLIIALAMLFAFCGLCALLDVSPLLGCMAMGMVYVNIAKDDKLFKQLNYFSPPFLLLFFVKSGVGFNMGGLFSGGSSLGVPLVAVSLVYLAVRMGGKYLGAFLGCSVMRKEKKVRNNLGLALIPQAGVAIGLAAMGAARLGGQTGEILETVIVAAGVLYEIIGPACAKLSLYLSGSYSEKLEELVTVEDTAPDGTPKTAVELLIERIRVIQSTIPPHEAHAAEEEQAFNEAAEEHYNASYTQWAGRRPFGRR
jgi:Kef-type K+ transport system membrane component KefB